MAVLWNREGHYIFILWFLLSLLFLFSRLISAVADRMSTIIPHVVWPSANLGCRSEMCCTRLAEIQDTKIAKKSPSGHHRTNLSGYIFATKACIDNRKKIVKQQYLLHMSDNMVNFGPLAAGIGLLVWDTPANFNGFCVLAALLHGTVVVGVSQTLRR